ncbi:hypothetical protein Btru_007032, partial [Bulinus truncatus]
SVSRLMTTYMFVGHKYIHYKNKLAIDIEDAVRERKHSQNCCFFIRVICSAVKTDMLFNNSVYSLTFSVSCCNPFILKPDKICIVEVHISEFDLKVKGYNNMAAHGIDRIPDSLGFLVMTEDGAVISSGGQLENDEVTANKITKLVHTAFKIPVTSEKKDTLRRISVILGDVILMATVSQHKIFVSKRHYVPQEPVQA